MHKPTVGSLFSGIGGLDLGFERAGFEVRWQVEIDDYCRRVLAKHWPDVKRCEDVRDVGMHNLERVDVIVGGFPCQPFSVAGQRRGTSDNRWLWPEFARVIRQLRPRYAVVENVPGILSGGLAHVLGDLAESRYDAEWRVLPAAAFGAPHRRERVFIVANTNCEWQLQPQGTFQKVRRWSGNGCEVANTQRNRLEEPRAARVSLWETTPIANSGWWATEPNVGRVANGIPKRVDRLRGLGNAVVPQVAQYVAECVMVHMQEH